MKKRGSIFGGSIFRSIMCSYLVICGIILVGSMAVHFYNYKVISDNIESIAKQRTQITAVSIDKEFAQLITSLRNIASDRELVRSLDMSQKEMGADIHELAQLRQLLLDNMHRSTIKEAFIYYNDTDSIITETTRLWNSQVIDSYISSLGMTTDEFDKIMDFPGITGGSIFADGRIWVMFNVYDDHYKKKAVIGFECLVSEIVPYEADGSVTALYDGDGSVYVTDCAGANLSEDTGELTEDVLEKDRYYYVGTQLSTMPWRVFVGEQKNSLYRSITIFWIILEIEVIGAVLIMIYMSAKSATRLWKPLQELLDVIQEKDDAGFMKTFREVNNKVSKIMTENSLMQRNVSKLKPYMDENRIRRILDGDITSEEAAIKVFSEYIGLKEGGYWSMVLVRPQKDKKGALLKEKGALSVESADKDIMSFTLKNIIDELTGSDECRVYKYGNDYIVFTPLPGNEIPDREDKINFEKKLERMRSFYDQTMGEPIYILLGEIYNSFKNVREIYLNIRSELDYRIFWRDAGSSQSIWVMETDTSPSEMVDFNEYSDTVRMMMNYIEAGNFKQAYQMMDTYISQTFPHNRRYLKQNIYRMYGLAASLTMSISSRMGKADADFLESLNYEERLMTVTSMEELREISKSIFSSIIDYMESQEKENMPVWMDDVQVYIQEHYTDQGLSVSGIADEYGFTVSHLSRTFKSVIGIGLLEYIQKLRVDKAKELLEEGASVNDAAVGSGYLDAKALTRAFKKYEGTTPGSYRDSKKQ